MNTSTNTSPPVDGIAELDEFFRDDRISPEPIQTDLEDFTGPTSQPVDQRKLHQPKKPEQTKPTGKTQKNKEAAKKGANHSRVEKKQQTTIQEHSSATEAMRPEASAAVERIDGGNVGHIATPPSGKLQTAPALQAGPRPLGLILSPAAAPPVDALSPRLAMVVAAVQRLVQAPVAIIISSLLAILALIAQGRVNVRQLHGGGGPTSLFLLSLGESGIRKSTVDKKMSRGAELAEAALRDAADNGTPPECSQQVIRTGTPEGILRVLKNGVGTAAILNDDAGSFFGGSAMNAENRMKTISWLSQVWDGSTISHVLADEDRTIFMAGRRLSAHLAMQPKLFLPLMADGSLLHQGILGRFLVTAPDSNIGYREIRMPDPADEKIVDDFAAEVHDRITADLRYREGSQELEPRELQLSNDAREVFASYATKVEFAQRPFGPYADLTGPASKFAENAIRIAGVLAFFDDADVTMISGECATRAVELMRFYATEMVRLLGAQRQSPLLASARDVLDYLHKGWGRPTIRFQDIYQFGPIRSAPENRPIVQVLELHGWLKRLAGNGYAGAGDVWAIVPRPTAEEMLGILPSNVLPA